MAAPAIIDAPEFEAVQKLRAQLCTEVVRPTGLEPVFPP
jgi:hypothetical protein